MNKSTVIIKKIHYRLLSKLSRTTPNLKPYTFCVLSGLKILSIDRETLPDTYDPSSEKYGERGASLQSNWDDKNKKLRKYLIFNARQGLPYQGTL